MATSAMYTIRNFLTLSQFAMSRSLYCMLASSLSLYASFLLLDFNIDLKLNLPELSLLTCSFSSFRALIELLLRMSHDSFSPIAAMRAPKLSDSHSIQFLICINGF